MGMLCSSASPLNDEEEALVQEYEQDIDQRFDSDKVPFEWIENAKERFRRIAVKWAKESPDRQSKYHMDRLRDQLNFSRGLIDKQGHWYGYC